MNKRVGPAILCSAVLCVAALFVFPRYGLAFYVVGCVGVGLGSVAWAIYSLFQRRWLPGVLVLVGLLTVLLLLFPPIHRR